MSDERVAIAGSGAIACGLATVAAQLGDVHLFARSEASAERARASIDKQRGKLGEKAGTGTVTVSTSWQDLAGATFFVEAVAEEVGVKAAVFGHLDTYAGDEAIFATTTSSLSIDQLAEASGRPDRFAGLHVFNPVPRMELIELAFPPTAAEETVIRATRLGESLGKTVIVVPDVPGFVVNKLLFPFLFSAVEFLEEHSMRPEDVDECMRLGAGHPMGPLALIDFVGLDVAAAIGRQIGADVPPRMDHLIDEGALGRKSGRGFYNYG